MRWPPAASFGGGRERQCRLPRPGQRLVTALARPLEQGHHGRHALIFGQMLHVLNRPTVAAHVLDVGPRMEQERHVGHPRPDPIEAAHQLEGLLPNGVRK